MLFALAFVACAPDSTDSGDPGSAGPEPWDELRTDLDPLRELLTVDVPAGADARLVPVAGLPALAAWSPSASGLALLDARYRLASTYGCLDPAPFPDLLDAVDRHGRCGPGLVELDRTHLGLTAPVLDVAEDPATAAVHVLLAGGQVRSANTDLLVGNPFDWLRLGAPITLTTAGGDPPTRIVAAEGGGWWGVAGATLGRWSAEGTVTDTVDLGGAATDLVRSGAYAWVSTGDGVQRGDGVSVAVAGAGVLAADGVGGVWVATAGGAVVPVSAAGVAGAAVSLGGAPRALAADPRTGKLYALVGDTLLVVEGGEEIGRASFVEPVAVAVNGSSEVSVLEAGGRLHVLVDETALGDAPPLSAWIATFFENPRQVASAVVCEGSEDGMEERVARALENRGFFLDIPATVALGLSPAAAAHARRCKVQDRFVELVEDDARLDPGVLFHDPPDCADQGCLDAAVADDLAQLTGLDFDPDWISGAAGWETGTADWVLALASLDMPARHAFVGLSALPEISMDDPRAKDALPWAGEAEAAPWRAASAASAGVDAAGGALLLLPGNTQAAFNLGGCPGVLQVECRLLGLGGGDTLDAEDLAVADLLLHRAAVHRSENGRDTWYMHLPAIETYAYTEGCTATDRVWSGGACQAALLQAWTYDVQARLVRNGVVRWGTPADAD